ncbi:MAG TPA: helix-turn-helix domain-containing protein [Roseiflexaceae bacterium]|jgi:DNA-binding transcriptional ArsR family regulator|nr:helix-turn-helix domain-containing protein [Roseiflexaceae bacterium]
MDLDLPRLSSAELVARFGNDEAALRRYRMLVALVREGRPPGEVARSFGVSRESLRRLRHAVAEHGLVALQRRKRGGGHLVRRSPLAAALQDELLADPSASSAMLWRRVQAALHAQGVDAPRSTFYRLLAQLREEEVARAGSQLSVDLLRDALGALAEDPPLALGKSDLALLLLPDVRDPLQRGRWMQRAIRGAIKRLRPSEAGPVIDDLRWRHYLIIAGEYEVGEKRTALQSALALSASTYSRAKREAMARLLSLLPDTLSDMPPPEPPASLFTPPAPPASFAAEAELELYTDLLRRNGMAVIWGAAVRETTDLAATLAARLRARGQKVVWHTCHASDDDTSVAMQLLATLAAALARDGHYGLWNQLREPLPWARRLETLAQALAGRHWTVVIAGADLLADDESLAIVDVLLGAHERRDMRLVVVSHTLPAWIGAERWPALPTLDDTEGRQRFLQQLAGDATAQEIAPELSRLLNRIGTLATTIQAQQVADISPKQRMDLLAALAPIEQFAADLRQIQLQREASAGAEAAETPLA